MISLVPASPGREDFLQRASLQQHLGDDGGHGLGEQREEAIATRV